MAMNAGDNEAVKIAGALEKNSTMKCINLANNHIKVSMLLHVEVAISVTNLPSLLYCQMNGANALAKVLQGQGCTCSCCAGSLMSHLRYV